MRDPHVRFCERHGRAISRAYSTAEPRRKRRGFKVEIGTALRCGGLIVLKPGGAKCRGIRMLNEAWVSMAKIGERLCLHAVSLQAVGAALKGVPLLPDDVVADEIAGVHRHTFHFFHPPSADLVYEIMNREPKHSRRFERHLNFYSRDSVHCGHIGRDCDMPRTIGGATEAAHLAGGRLGSA